MKCKKKVNEKKFKEKKVNGRRLNRKSYMYLSQTL